MVDPGIYTVRLTKKKKVYESKIELQPNRLARHSPEDQKVRQKALWKTYGLLEHMAYISDTLSEIKTKIEEILKKEDKKLPRKVKKSLEKQAEAAEAIWSEMIDPSGNIYGSGELQGKMIEIFSTINGYLGRPTDSQLTYIDTLEKSLNKVEEKFAKFVKDNLVKVNRLLKGRQLKEIKILSEEEYTKKAKKE